jgi:hypothetical protein
VPSRCRMRPIDRDLIRGGHYGQRPCLPRLKAEHMAAPTNPANVKKALANPEPSTHGTFRKCCDVRFTAVIRGKAGSDTDIVKLSRRPISDFESFARGGTFCLTDLSGNRY